MNAQKIRELCKKHRISLKELAEKIGLTPTGMQHILRYNGTNTATLERIARELGVHPGYFFDDSPVKSDKYGVVSLIPPLVAESYPAKNFAEQEVIRGSADVYKQLADLQAEKIKLLEEKLKGLEDKD